MASRAAVVATWVLVAVKMAVMANLAGVRVVAMAVEATVAGWYHKWRLGAHYFEAADSVPTVWLRTKCLSLR